MSPRIVLDVTWHGCGGSSTHLIVLRDTVRGRRRLRRKLPILHVPLYLTALQIEKFGLEGRRDLIILRGLRKVTVNYLGRDRGGVLLGRHKVSLPDLVWREITSSPAHWQRCCPYFGFRKRRHHIVLVLIVVILVGHFLLFATLIVYSL